MKDKKMFFTSSRNINRYTYNIYLADILKNLWNNNNNNDEEDDDHYYNVHNLTNFPPTIKGYKLKNRHIQMENELKKKLQSL